MLFHHQEKPPTEAELADLLRQGESARGMVTETAVSEADRGRTRVRIEVRFKDGQTVDFGEELANIYQPDPGTPDAQRLIQARADEHLRHPDKVPKIQLALSQGAMVPVRYDPAHRERMVIDQAALHQIAMKEFIDQEKYKNKKAAGPIAAGPPWAVPSVCPSCGAPVDQAKASRDQDPKCPFCREPIPVQPARR